MPAMTSLALGGAALGGLLGGIGGSSGSTQDTTKNIAPVGAVEQGLQNSSVQNYNDAQNLEGGLEGNIGASQNLQNQAQGVNSNILNGSQFNLSPEQQAQIDSIRNASINAGTSDIQNFVNQNLGSVQSDAANRGLQGQALSELQGRTINEGTRQYTNMVNQANATAANQSLQTPYQQAQLQSGVAQNSISNANNLQQQAINNRNTLQNPALMNDLANQRLAASGTTTTTPGNIGSTIGGVLGGIGSGLSAVGGINSAINPAQKNTQSNFAHGGVIPGIPNFRGDHIANDTVKINASPGEGIIPNSHMRSPKLAKAYIDYMHESHMVPNWRA